MKDIGKTYRGKRITLDGRHFEACTFDRCELDFAGGIPPVLAECSFHDCSFTFSGKAAYTLAFLSGMHGGGFAAMVEGTFAAIREGAYRSLPVQDLAAPPAGPPAAPADAHPLSFRIPRIVQRPKN